jgi:hypothetical protein
MDPFQRIYFEHCLVTAMWAGGVTLALVVLGAVGGWNPAAAARFLSVGLVVGFLAGLVTVDGLPPLPVHERWQWSAWLTTATLLLLYAEEGKAAPVTRFPLMVLLSFALEWLVVRPALSLGQASDMVRLGVFVAIGIAIFALFASFEARVARLPMWRVFTSCGITAAGAAFAYAASISTRLGQMTGGLAACFGAAAVVGFGKSDIVAGRTPVSVATMAFLGLLLVSGLSSDFSKVAAVLLLISWMIPLVPHPGTAKTNAIQIGAIVVTSTLAALLAKA